MKPISEIEARRRAALREALARRRPTITDAEKRRSGQNAVTHGARSAAVVWATRYADAVILALSPKLSKVSKNFKGTSV